MYDLAVTQIDQLNKLNNDMLGSCVLFERGGNYSQAEIEWYSQQMNEISDMLNKVREDRQAKLQELTEKLNKLLKEPLEEFESEYKNGIHNLSAKEGLGTKFG